MRFKKSLSDSVYDPRSYSLLSFRNKILAFSVTAFILVTGGNFSVLRDARIDNLKPLRKEKGQRLLAFKNRAGKDVELYFGHRFERLIWNKIIALREKYLKDDVSDLIFPYRADSGEITRIPPKLLESNGTAAKFFRKHYQPIWITSRALRKEKTSLLLKETNNDVIKTAQLQGHTVRTALRSYVSVNLNEAANEISNALNLVFESAISRTRNTEYIGVNILDKYNQDQHTPLGECLSKDELKPNRAEGFTEHSPTPDCSSKETCIFCEHYAVHADRTDIKRLLSLRFLIKELETGMMQDDFAVKWTPFLHRIEEIINTILNKGPSIEAEYKVALKEVEVGNLDEFWSLHLETLFAVGVIS